MAKHSIAEIAGSPQSGLHLRSGFRTLLGCFYSSPGCLRSRLVILLPCVYEGIERVEHGAIARFCATQFADGQATLFKRLHPLRPFNCAGAPENVSTAQKKHSIERPR